MSSFIKNSKGVSPVIGLILMVTITIIFAAIIISAVGPDPLKNAPQADIRAIGDTIAGDTVIKLMHQGGEELSFTSSQTKIMITGNSSFENEVSFEKLKTENDRKFVTGDSLYLYVAGGKVCVGNKTLPDADHTVIAKSGDIINLKILDVNSQQMIADISARF